MTALEAISWLEGASRYFSLKNQHAKEDREIWSNTYNAENCLKIAELIKDICKDERVSN